MCPIPLWRVPRINLRDIKFLSSASFSGWKLVVITERLINYLCVIISPIRLSNITTASLMELFIHM